MHRPFVRVGGYHVEVPVHEQRAPRRVGALEPGHHAGPAGCRLADLRYQADLVEQPGDVLGRGPLAGAGGQVAGVRGVDADQVAAQLHDFLDGIGHHLVIPGAVCRSEGSGTPGA